MENEIRPMSDRPYTKKDYEDMFARMERLAEKYAAKEAATDKDAECDKADKQRKIG